MILCSGAFDGLHAGHVRYLEAAKALCEPDELLVCAVAPDAYIQTVKGRAPSWPQAQRLATVKCLMMVDGTIRQESLTVAPVIRTHLPRLLVKGPDWKDRLPDEVHRACADVGTTIAFVDTPGTHVRETIRSDEEALARFEALVLSQQPAATPWTPVTDYSFESRKAIEGIHPQLIKDVFAPRIVMDAGMGPGHLVHLLRDLDVRAFGFDTGRGDTCYGNLACPYPETMHRNPEQPTWRGFPNLWRGYDLVICREVLEHLTVRDICHAVRNLCHLSRQYVYVTTRFAAAPTHLLDVDTADDLDPTHISLLNITLLRALFVLEGFKRRADLEVKMDWKQVGRCLVYERV